MGLGIRESKRKSGKVTKSRTFTAYIDTGERYPDGRKRYKQIRRVIKKNTRAKDKLLTFPHIVSPKLEVSYNKIITAKKLEQREWKRHESVKRIQVEYFGDIELTQITKDKCKEYKNHRLIQGIAFGTLDTELAILKHIMIEAGIKSPIDKSIFINKPTRRQRILTIEEQAILFPALALNARRIAETIVNCGPRPGEACRIKKASVDLSTNTLHLTETKGSKPRQIPFGPLQRELFKEAIQESSQDLIFLNRHGEPYTTKSYDEHFKQTCVQLGIANLKPHDLRHTFATRLCRSNVNLRKVQYYMGHASIKTTERYTHIDTESREDILIAEGFTKNARELEKRRSRV